MLANTINVNQGLMDGKLEAILEVLEGIDPETREQFDKIMFGKKAYGLRMALYSARQGETGPQTLEIIKNINEQLDDMKEFVKEQGWLSALHKAERRAVHNIQDLETNAEPKLKIVEPGNETGESNNL